MRRPARQAAGGRDPSDEDALKVCTPHCGVAPETPSGGETYERELLVRLGRRGVALDVILARGKRHPIDVPNWTVHRFAIGRGLRWWIAPAVVPRAIKRVWDAGGFDLLRVHSLRFIGPSALWARRRFRLPVPVVAHHHHLDPSPLNRVIERRVVDSADRVVVGSEFARRQLAAELGCRTDHVAVVPYGIDERFAPAPRRPDLAARYGLGDGPVLLFLGGLKPRKNLPLLLDVFARVAPATPTARLVVAGGGPLRADLERRARDLGLGARIVFTGYVPEAEKVDHFNLADVFVFPSSMEGFGLAIGEAMSCGLPVIASDRGSIPEVLMDGDGGFLVDCSAPERFAERLSGLLADAGLRAAFGRANRARIDAHFRWERCVAGTTAVYEQTLADWCGPAAVGA
jgi:phosphatidylinositol alpha-1,6-mannosyltransferase